MTAREFATIYISQCNDWVPTIDMVLKAIDEYVADMTTVKYVEFPDTELPTGPSNFEENLVEFVRNRCFRECILNLIFDALDKRFKKKT